MLSERLGETIMRNSSLYRSNISSEKVAFLSEIKNQKDFDTEESNEPKAYKRLGKQKELDLLWQNFKISAKEEKSPGIYLLTGFIAGVLSMFVMNSVFSIGADITNTDNPSALGQPKYEKKFSRKSKLPQIAVIPASEKASGEVEIPTYESYTVKSGDSMSSIVIRFYGKYDLDKVEKIKQANNLSSANKLSIGQKLVIPMN